MRHFRNRHFVGVGSKAPGNPSGKPAHAAGNSFTFTAGTASNARLTRRIIILGIVLVAAIIAATGLMLLNLRDRELAVTEHELKSLTFVLVEQIDRSFQSMELIQTAVIERMQKLRIASAEDNERQMSGQDTYQHLKDQISGLPYIDALVLLDTEGKIINVSRAWPSPPVKRPDLDDALGVLNERDRRIFEGRCLVEDPITLAELAGKFGLSRERVRQIEALAFEKVQKAVKNRVATIETPVHQPMH